MKLHDHICPKCGKETLEIQQGSTDGVIWCANLNLGADKRACDFGLGDGEKTLSDLPAQKAA